MFVKCRASIWRAEKYASRGGTDTRGQGYSKAHNEPGRHANFNVQGSEKDDTKRNIMRNKLLATVAMTALIGCTSLAVAQNAGTEAPPAKATTQPAGGQQHQMAPGRRHGPAPGRPRTCQPPPTNQPHPTAAAAAERRRDLNDADEQPGGQMKPGGSAQNQPPQAAPDRKSGFPFSGKEPRQCDTAAWRPRQCDAAAWRPRQ